jgi:mycoredoxin-dependent peroxiredoxin
MTIDVGQPAPDFELRDQHGQPVRLSSFRGRKTVVVMFYPFAFSRVCTSELDAVRDDLATFQSDRVQLLAVSCDPVFSLRAFADQDGLTFPLLSDFWPHGATAAAYGVLDTDRGSAHRSTYIVGTDGVVRWCAHNPAGQPRDLEEQARVLVEVVRDRSGPVPTT